MQTFHTRGVLRSPVPAMPSLITMQTFHTQEVFRSSDLDALTDYCAGLPHSASGCCQGCLLTVAMPQVPPSDPSEIQPECSREQLNSRKVRGHGAWPHWCAREERRWGGPLAHGVSQARALPGSRLPFSLKIFLSTGPLQGVRGQATNERIKIISFEHF